MLNRVTFIGRMVKEPELKKIGKGESQVANFTIAIDNWAKDAEGNRTTSFINCVAWNQTAEHLAKWGRKGILTAIEGRLSQRTFERKDGSKGSVIEILVDGFDFLESITKEPALTTIKADEDREQPELDPDKIAKLEAELAAAKQGK